MHKLILLALSLACAQAQINYVYMTPELSRAGGRVEVLGYGFCLYGSPIKAALQGNKWRTATSYSCPDPNLNSMVFDFTENDLLDGSGVYTPGTGKTMDFMHGTHPDSCSGCITLLPTPDITSVTVSSGSYWPACGTPTLTIGGDNFPTACNRIRYLDLREYQNAGHQIEVYQPSAFLSCTKTQLVVQMAGDTDLFNHCYRLNVNVGWGDSGGSSYTEEQNSLKGCDDGNPFCGGSGSNLCNNC